MLADAWGTELGLPEELLSTMALVELPSLLPPPLGYEEAERVQNALYLQGIEVPVKALNGRLYVRAWALEGPFRGRSEAFRPTSTTTSRLMGIGKVS